MTNETKTHIKPFSGSNYQANARKCGEFEPCAVCGKAVKNVRFAMEIFEGGSTFGESLTPEEKRYHRGNDNGYMGSYPVGADCAKVLRANGLEVINVKIDDNFEPPTVGNEVV